MVKNVQKYVSRNKEKVIAYNIKFGKSIAGKYRLLKYRHKNRKWKDGIISLKEYSKLYEKKCIYCGDESMGGIDRIDNKLGYSKKNSKSCCKMCNYMKNQHTTEKFLNHIKKIYEYNKQNSNRASH